jgi:hypothetical protein
MFGDGSLTLREFAMNEPLPLARIHDAVLEFLRNREDAALFGAQAVNAYVDEARMTQDVDVLSTRAGDLAEDVREHLNRTFNIAVRVREVVAGLGFRVYQLREPKNRHLVDVRQVDDLPPTEVVGDVRVVTPLELIAYKVIAYDSRRGQPKSGTDWRDLAMLLLKYPQFKTTQGDVRDRLARLDAPLSALEFWDTLVATDLSAGDDE